MADSKPTPLVFVYEHGRASLPIASSDAAHFAMLALLVEPADAEAVRTRIREAMSSANESTGEGTSAQTIAARRRKLLLRFNEIPFKFYAVVVDKRAIELGSALSDPASFYRFFAGLLYRKLFVAFPNLHVVASGEDGNAVQAGLSGYLRDHHQDTLFDRPTVTLGQSSVEPILELAHVLCSALAHGYDSAPLGGSEPPLAVLHERHAILIDEWPVRYRPSTSQWEVVPSDPADGEVARYSITRAEDFIETHDRTLEEDKRAQVLALKKLLYELRFGDPHAYVTRVDLQQTLEALGAWRSDQWLRSSVIAPLRDSGVLIASSHQGYKIPVTVSDIGDFVNVTDTIVHPMLNRVSRARDAVLAVTRGKVDVLAGDKLSLLRAAVEAIGNKPR